MEQNLFTQSILVRFVWKLELAEKTIEIKVGKRKSERMQREKKTYEKKRNFYPALAGSWKRNALLIIRKIHDRFFSHFVFIYLSVFWVFLVFSPFVFYLPYFSRLFSSFSLSCASYFITTVFSKNIISNGNTRIPSRSAFFALNFSDVLVADKKQVVYHENKKK